MKVVFTSVLAASLVIGSSVAWAQEAEPAPVRKPRQEAQAPRPEAQAPRQEPSAAQAGARDVAVPRSEAPRAEKARSESGRASGGWSDASRVSSSSAAPDEEQAERRGAVRRPPSDGGRGQGQAPRDRAVARSGAPPRDYDRDRGRGDRVIYYPSYYSYGRYYDPYYSGGFHLGYLAYSPWGWTPSFYGYPYGSGYGGYRGQGYDLGALRIKVKPRDAEVYVDGYYAGTVDDFDGIFQSLKLELGGYKIEIRKPGFETLTFDVHLQPERTITYRGDLQPVP